MLRLLIDPSELAPGELAVRGDDHHYLFHVRRMRPGDRLVLFDGEGREAEAEVKSVGSRAATLEVTAGVVVAPARAAASLTVILSLIKGERMDSCLTKLVEIGVGRIVPLLAERSVVRLDGERAEKRRERYRALVRAAVQQCRAVQVPVVDPICSLDQALALTADAELKVVFWEGAQAVPLRSVLPDATPQRTLVRQPDSSPSGGSPVGTPQRTLVRQPDSSPSGGSTVATPAGVVILVGPEGGLSPEEVDSAVASGFRVAGLGPRILRADTAAVAAAAILAYALGDI